MKRVILTVCLMTVGALFLSTCFNPWTGEEGTGSVTISIGSGNSRATNFTDADINGFLHYVSMEGPNGEVQEAAPFQGRGTAKFNVTYGQRYYFLVVAKTSAGVVKAVGETDQVINRGTTSVKIEMEGSFFTIVFNSNGGTNVPNEVAVPGGHIIHHPTPTKAYLPTTAGLYGGDVTQEVFDGWFTDNSLSTQWNFTTNTVPPDFTSGNTINLYAKWIAPSVNTPITLTGGTANDIWPATSYVNYTSNPDGEYTLVIDSDTQIADQKLDRSNTSLIIIGTTPCTISLYTGMPSTLFVIGDIYGNTNINLTIGNNITLKGHNANITPLVVVEDNGTFTMNSGSSITGNTAGNSANGGGVFVDYGGYFVMNGGTISGNTATGIGGGGVYVSNNSKFTMNGGTISGNTATSSSDGYGGGVCVSGGDFTMSGGTISGNTANTGAALYISGGTATYGDGTDIGGSITPRNVENTITGH